MFAPDLRAIPCGHCEPCQDGAPQRCAYRLGLVQRLGEAQTDEGGADPSVRGSGRAGAQTANGVEGASRPKCEERDNA